MTITLHLYYLWYFLYTFYMIVVGMCIAYAGEDVSMGRSKWCYLLAPIWPVVFLYEVICVIRES